MCKIRGNQISMIFQQPTSCLNPVFKVGDQISEVLMLHRGMSHDQADEARDRVVEHGRHPLGQDAAPRATRTRCPAACASA